MAVKRLGGTPASSKVAVIGAAVASELGDVSRQLDTPIDRNKGVYERVPLDNVSPDPKNPRNLKLTFEELREGVAALQKGLSEATTDRQKTYEWIAELAETFKEVGQQQPIVTYRDERGQLRIIDGENRWAFIDTKIKPKRPEYLRLEQYIANVHRAGLTLGQHLTNLEMVVQEAQEQGKEVTSINQLAVLIHRPRTTVQYWWGVLRGPEDVREAIRNGKLSSIERAYTAAQERDDGRRAALLAGEVLPLRGLERAAVKRGGRPKRRVSLGAVRDSEVIKTLIQAVELEESFEAIDWSDLGAVQKTWQRFLKALESRIKKTKVEAGSRSDD